MRTSKQIEFQIAALTKKQKNLKPNQIHTFYQLDNLKIKLRKEYEEAKKFELLAQ